MWRQREVSMEVYAKEGEYGGICLMTAAIHGHLAICRLLIDKGAQLEAKDRDGMTLLRWAANQGLVEIVRLLCDCGADIEVSPSRLLGFTCWYHLSEGKYL